MACAVALRKRKAAALPATVCEKSFVISPFVFSCRLSALGPPSQVGKNT